MDDDGAAIEEKPELNDTIQKRKRSKLRQLRVDTLSKRQQLPILEPFPNPPQVKHTLIYILSIGVAILLVVFYYRYLLSAFIPTARLQVFEEKVAKFINEQIDESCQNRFDGGGISKELHEHVLHQDKALLALDHIIQSHEAISSLSLVGGAGTGKSMTTNIIRQGFAWPNNVFHILYPTLGSQQLTQLVDLTFHRFSVCGHNLLIVDSIPASGEPLIAKFHKVLLDLLVRKRIYAIIVYVYNIPTFLDDQILGLEENIGHVVAANNASNIQSIVYQPISSEGVRQCIARIRSDRGQDQLRSDQEDAIVRSIDASRSGCKQVYARLSLYS